MKTIRRSRWATEIRIRWFDLVILPLIGIALCEILFLTALGMLLYQRLR